MPTLTRTLLAVMALMVLSGHFSGSMLHAQQLDPSFHPPVLAPLPGLSISVSRVLRQADGRYIIAGYFQSVDGHATNCLARLLPDGHVDTTFTYQPYLPVYGQGGWGGLAVQADGKILYSFPTNAPLGVMGRLLPSGQPDNTFRARLASRPRGHNIGQIEVQPDGKLLLAGYTTDSLGRNGIVRLLPNGQVDAAFNPPAFVAEPDYLSMLLEPSGRILYARSPFQGQGPPTSMRRLLASGRIDSSFSFNQTQFPSSQVSRMVRCADGSYMLGGWFQTKAVAHIGANGAWDTTFPFSLTCFAISLGYGPTNPVSDLVVLPNGKALASGSMVINTGDAPMLQALSGGGDDASFNPDFIYTPYPYRGTIYNAARVADLLLEPSGKLLVAGQFQQAGGVNHWGLARLLPAAPLSAQGTAAAAQLAVWPVPAHGQLQVKLPAGPLPQQVTLLDATGRTVLAMQPKEAALTLNTSALPAGLYVLQVRHADGAVASRRVVLE